MKNMIPPSIAHYASIFAFVATTLVHADSTIKPDSSISLIPKITFSGSAKGEQFYAQNYSLLNNNNYHIDRIFFARTVTDLRIQALSDLGIELNIGLRNKNCPGILGSVGKTNPAEVKIGDTVVGGHSHTLPLQLFWMREGWMSFDLTNILGLSFVGQQRFKLGAFSFELGRAISLGSAYAVGPEVLGFYSDSAIDQFAYGALFTGDIVSDILTYDLYATILQNKSGTLGETGLKIYGQETNRIGRAERGFGKINFIVAGRTQWHVFNTPDLGKLTFEPYAVYNSDPEQKVEFFGDASSKLATIGFSGEYKGSRFEGGFDSAMNLGYQKVKGWDRNQIAQENRNGAIAVVNSHVNEAYTYDGQTTTDKAIYFPAVQTIVDGAAQGESHNGEQIGSYSYVAVPTAAVSTAIPITKTLTNASNRYRDSYINTYEGWMFVADASAWLYKKDLSANIEIGVASGDDNPNIDTQDRNYSGFIGLQEVYSGNRVRSAFVLGGAGKLPRPLSQPISTQAPTPFSNIVSGFSNLVYGGTGIKWAPKNYSHKFTVNPNIITYFQHYQTRAFDALSGVELDCNASPHMGVEANIFFDYSPLKDVKVYGVGSYFFPGQHYTDIKGKPLNREQQRALDRLDRTGFHADKVPGIGDDTAFTFNLGILYSF